MFRKNILPLISACSVGIGAFLGSKYEQCKTDSSASATSFFPRDFHVHASSVAVGSAPPLSPASSNVSEIMRLGYPSMGNLQVFDDFALMYDIDRLNKNAFWVFEHLTPNKLPSAKHSNVNREKSHFFEDKEMHEYFRSMREDFKHSGFDRGHMAAAGNHRHSQNAMDQTFVLSNISPQVGKGFNRGIWNDLEKYVRAIARKNKNTYVCTGPLYLPKKEEDGKVYVKYQVIGRNQVAVPTHFFKVVVSETNDGSFDMLSYVLPNEPIPDKTPFANYYTPVDAIERASGFLLFDKLPRKQFRYVNGKKGRW